MPYNAWIKSTWKKIKIECREEKLGEIVAEALSFLCQSCPDQRGGRSSSMCSSSVSLQWLKSMLQHIFNDLCWKPLHRAQKLQPAQMGWRVMTSVCPRLPGRKEGGNPCSSRPEAPAPLMAGPHTRFTCCAHCSQSMGYKCLILLLATRIYYKAHTDVWKAFARVLFRARKLESTVDNLYLVMQKSSNADTNADR